MTLAVEDRQAAAGALAPAERDPARIPPLTDRWPELDAVDAYQIQLANVGDRLAGGRTVPGHKDGLSAQAMNEMFGVDEPDYGHLLDDMFVFEGTGIPAADKCFPRVEEKMGVAEPVYGWPTP